MLARREIVLGGLVSLLWVPSHGYCQAPDHGCMLSDSELAGKLGGNTDGWAFDINHDPLRGGSGDRDFDRALANTLLKISDLFNVLPGFAFFDEDMGPNAFASQSQRLQRADGSVVFGQQLLQKLLAAPEHPAASVASVCAHEFGHIVQHKRGLPQLLVGPDGRVKRLELHADFLAGYFAGKRKKERSDFPAATFALTQFNAGDRMLNHPQHHGTPEERGRAVVEGFQAAYRDNKSFSEAIEAGVRYVNAA